MVRLVTQHGTLDRRSKILPCMRVDFCISCMRFAVFTKSQIRFENGDIELRVDQLMSGRLKSSNIRSFPSITEDNELKQFHTSS